MRKIARTRVFVYVFVCVLCVWGGDVEMSMTQREKERAREHASEHGSKPLHE